MKTLKEIEAVYKKGSPEWYQAAYKIIKFDKGFDAQILATAKRVLAGKPRYVSIEVFTGVPWYMIACVHNMECSGNFKGVLHNGEPIVGTGQKTKLVPAGCGPFATWEDAALDAIKTQSLYKVPIWTIGHILKQCELFNGSGYLKYHGNENSPYVWACSNINDGTGKYVADGKWSETAKTNGQVGAATIIRQLEIMGELKPLFT